MATCSKVAGESPCLDFEEKPGFDFMFTVADSSGEGSRNLGGYSGVLLWIWWGFGGVLVRIY